MTAALTGPARTALRLAIMREATVMSDDNHEGEGHDGDDGMDELRQQNAVCAVLVNAVRELHERLAVLGWRPRSHETRP